MSNYRAKLATDRRAALGFIGALLLACPVGIGLWAIIVLAGWLLLR